MSDPRPAMAASSELTEASTSSPGLGNHIKRFGWHSNVSGFESCLTLFINFRKNYKVLSKRS